MAQELKVDVHGPEISISVRGTCLKTTYRKGDAPWLVCTELKADDPQAVFTREQFRALAWTTANAKARELGWIDSHTETTVITHSTTVPADIA